MNLVGVHFPERGKEEKEKNKKRKEVKGERERAKKTIYKIERQLSQFAAIKLHIVTAQHGMVTKVTAILAHCDAHPCNQ